MQITKRFGIPVSCRLVSIYEMYCCSCTYIFMAIGGLNGPQCLLDDRACDLENLIFYLVRFGAGSQRATRLPSECLEFKRSKQTVEY